MPEIGSHAVLGLLQGLTEFLPVSSSGHLILARDYLGLLGSGDLAVDAVLQLATALALVVYFWRDILRICYTFLYWITGRPTEATERTLLLAIIAGTIPAIIAGLLLEDAMETVFRSAELVAYTLIAGSLIMLAAEYLAKSGTATLTWTKGLVIGLFQCLALIPGMSRSGMTISGGMFMGLTRPEAARFGFLLAAPILIGSGLKKLIELESSGTLSTMGAPIAAGFVASFLSGLLAVHLLLIIVRRTPLTVFVVYRLLLAALILLLA